jgi:colanic acid/amylovoran biosynthesis glycosyltransferase
MKVAFIVGQFPSISETFILRQITGLLERGHHVDIFAYTPGRDPLRHPDVDKHNLLDHTYYLNACGCSQRAPVRLVGRVGLLFTNFHKHPRVIFRTLNVATFGKAALLLQILCQAAPFFDKGPYDVLHCQFGPLGELGLLLRDTGVFHGKIITSFRGYDISSYVRDQGENSYQDLFKRGDLFLCVSQRIKANLIRLGCDARKIIVHRSGIDTNKFALMGESKKNGMTTILTIARLVEKKGVEYGIEAVAEIVKRHPRIKYKIAGEGPLKDKLQVLIAELKVGDNIKLVGWKSQDQITELLKTSDILLAPSVTSSTGDQEGIPGAIMEAFAAGLPVVSTNHAGIPELVQDGDSGFLVPEKDVKALVQKLEILIEQPELRDAMGRTGRTTVEEYYNIETLNNRLVEVYQQLLRGEFAPAHL